MKRWMALTVLLTGVGTALALDEAWQTKVKDYPLTTMPDGTPYLNLETAARAILGEGVKPAPAPLAELLVALAERVPAGGALHLGRLATLVGEQGPRLDLRRIQDNIVITGDGDIVLGGGQKNHQVLCGPGLEIRPPAEGRKGPIEGLTMLFGHCPRITGDVKGSDFIAAVNGWASYGFKAEARIDDTLFLWFSRNWTFADYNAHLKTPAKQWWKDNCQAYFDLKGGGQGSRIYLMIETDYGNPGVGVWLKDCDGLALYHGATERGSSQGPGCYYLQNCRNVQLGLRRIFPGTRGFDNGAMPAHAITIEGGAGNILHFFSDFANAYDASLVNSDPRLQLWGASFDFEAKGVDRPEILRFAYTPLNNMPVGTNVQEAARIADNEAAKWMTKRARRIGFTETPAMVEQLKDLIRRGRDWWWPLNATSEETFTFAGRDLTKGAEGVRERLPAPPGIPPTDAPRSFRPLYFTWEAGFGRALLDAGADPTGRKPSDDAFARVMFGLPADEVQRLYKAIVENQDKTAYATLFPANPRQPNSTKPSDAVRRPRVDVPAGTFLLTRTLIFGPGAKGMIGAGPDKTVLKFTGAGSVIRQFNPCGFYNFAIEGGRVGIDITGGDHGGGGLLKTAYVAGDNYYNITFRGQTFAGIQVGGPDPEVVGGAEHDQNKYVNLTFDRTGDYGIFFGNTMLDKWLCLNGTFTGQKKAGISIKFNNLIHGGLFNCVFRDIDGPGIDFMGGNPMLTFRPYIVMVDQCEFSECGNARQPAVDYGYGELMSFTRVNISTRGKAIKGGYIGAAQHLEDVAVDVKLVEGASAVTLRGVRNGATARANGHILKNVRAATPVAFVNDANAQNERFSKTLARHQAGAHTPSVNVPPADAAKAVALDWDVNPSARALAPTNGWVHPFLFENCVFGDRTYAYSLLNVSTDAGRVLTEVDLAP